MRSVAYCLLSLLFALPAVALPSKLTVILDFERQHSALALSSMQHEVEAILKEAGLSLDWKLRAQISSTDHFEDLVIVKMRGRCEMDSFPVIYDERGPYAFTHTADGQVLPFSEVQCDKVSRSIKQVMAGADFGRRDLLFGRALGRVLAHEMYHILGKTSCHSHEGVAKTALSARQLIAEALTLDNASREAILSRRRE